MLSNNQTNRKEPAAFARYLKVTYAETTSLINALRYLSIQPDTMLLQQSECEILEWIRVQEEKITECLERAFQNAVLFGADGEVLHFQIELGRELLHYLSKSVKQGTRNQDIYQKALGRELNEDEAAIIDHHDFMRQRLFMEWLDIMAEHISRCFVNEVYTSMRFTVYVSHVLLRGEEGVKRIGLDLYRRMVENLEMVLEQAPGNFDEYLRDFECALNEED